MDVKRVTTIKDWPKPKTYQDVQVFLGYANFYRRFIYGYLSIATLLRQESKAMESMDSEYDVVVD